MIDERKVKAGRNSPPMSKDRCLSRLRVVIVGLGMQHSDVTLPTLP